MDPSAVSRAVSLLEKECGTVLLERRGRGVAPTDAGELLSVYLRRQESQKQHLLAQMDAIRKVERGHIDIVAGEGYIDWLMRHSLQAFMREHPAITVSLEVGSSDEIVRRVIDERAHIGLLFQPPRDERLRSHRPLKLADLLPYPGATLQRSFGVRQHIEAAEIGEGVRLPTLLTTSSFSALGYFVVAGLGYALSTRMSLPPHLDTAAVVELPMRNPLLHQGRSHVISRHGRMLAPAATELLRLVVDDMARTMGAANREAPPGQG
jgi:DNA-binding transcriptional LysR family regulator